MLGATMERALYEEREPVPRDRAPDDSRFVLDHLFTKLLRLEETMATASGRAEARVRSEIGAVEASDAAKEVFADVALTVPLKDFLTTTAYDRLP